MTPSSSELDAVYLIMIGSSFVGLLNKYSKLIVNSIVTYGVCYIMI